MATAHRPCLSQLPSLQLGAPSLSVPIARKLPSKHKRAVDPTAWTSGSQAIPPHSLTLPILLGS